MNYKWLYAATVATAVIVAPAIADASFKDVKQGTELSEAIQSLVERKVISGYSDDTFKPSNQVTRAQFAKILAGALQLDTENVQNPNFKDVPQTHSNYKYIAALANKGIISGSNGNFNPNGKVTRGQLAKMLSIGYELDIEKYIYIPFSDVHDSSNWKYIRALYLYEITKGTTDSLFGVNQPVTRGQLATFVHRVEKFKALPKFDETVVGDVAVLDHVQFGAVQVRTTTDEEYNPGIIDVYLSEGGDQLTFTPLKEGTAFINVIAYTPDMGSHVEYVGYQFDVENVNGKLQVTMTALDAPKPLYAALQSNRYTSVDLYDINGRKVEADSYSKYDEDSEEDFLYVAADIGSYKAEFTTKTGEKEEKYIVIDGNPYYTSIITGQYFASNPIEIKLHAALKNISAEVYTEDMTIIHEDATSILKIVNPKPSRTYLVAEVNGDTETYILNINSFGDGFIISDFVLDFLTTGIAQY